MLYAFRVMGIILWELNALPEQSCAKGKKKAKAVLSCSSVFLVLGHWWDAAKEPFPILLGVYLPPANVWACECILKVGIRRH